MWNADRRRTGCPGRRTRRPGLYLVGLLVVLLMPTIAWSQSRESQPRAASSVSRPDGCRGDACAASTVSNGTVSGVSVDRIRRELREAPRTTNRLLRYDYRVDVYGTGPRIDFFKDYNLSSDTPVQYGGMTHQEFLDVVTPQPFRAPVVNLARLIPNR